MNVDTEELTNFINAVKDGIAKSEENNKFSLMSNIDFELSVVTTKQSGGKINLVIAGAGGEYEKQAISKIKFSMGSQATMDRGITALVSAFAGLASLDKPQRKKLPKPKKL